MFINPNLLLLICNLLYINAYATLMELNKCIKILFGELPAVIVSLSLALRSSIFNLVWISNLLQNPSLGFQRDCSMSGFSLSPITRRHSVCHWWAIPVCPITSQSTYASGSSFSRQYL